VLLFYQHTLNLYPNPMLHCMLLVQPS
jgi:hypothetical protein